MISGGESFPANRIILEHAKFHLVATARARAEAFSIEDKHPSRLRVHRPSKRGPAQALLSSICVATPVNGCVHSPPPGSP